MTPESQLMTHSVCTHQLQLIQAEILTLLGWMVVAMDSTKMTTTKFGTRA
jgi:hypothetical protein